MIFQMYIYLHVILIINYQQPYIIMKGTTMELVE